MVKAIRKKQGGCVHAPAALLVTEAVAYASSSTRECNPCMHACASVCVRLVRICIIAGDISPIDVISHVPIMCEDAGIPYCYVTSKQELGAAGSTKRPTSVVLCLGTDADNAELRDECCAKVKELPAPH